MKNLTRNEQIAVVILALTGILFLAVLRTHGQTPAKPAGCSCIKCACKSGQCPACPALQVTTPAASRVVKSETRQECTGRSCRLVRYEWHEFAADPRKHVLTRDGVTVGGWDYDACHWRPYNAARDTWGAAVENPPLPVPGVENPPAKTTFDPNLVMFGDGNNYGLDLEEIRKDEKRQKYTRNGREITRVEALAAVGQLPDDADTLKVTWVGSAPTGERIREDIAASPWKGKVSYQSYSSLDEPLLRGKGFAAGLQVQAPGGRPLFHADTYGDTPLGEMLTLAEERRADAGFKPASWAEARKGVAKPSPAPADPKDLIAAYWPWAAGVLLLWLALRRRRTA